jgi:CheY-like chemotaxis protein
MRLLIVEDDPDGREMLAELFRLHEWDVTAVPTTESGMSELRTGGFDVVISDENLEGQSGSTMLRQANEEGLLCNVGVLMYTAEPGRLQVPDGVRVLRKPLGITTLLDEANAAVPETHHDLDAADERNGTNGTSTTEASHAISRGAAPETPAPPPSSRRVRRSKVELVLYVTDSPSSRRALQNLRHVLEETHVSRVHVEVRNVAEYPLDPALDAGISFTPVLVKRDPQQSERYVCALESTHSLAALIEELEASAPVSSRTMQELPPPSSVAK